MQRSATSPQGRRERRGNEVAVTTEGSKTLLIVDVAAGKVTTAIETDQNGSHMVALAPTHDRAFVANIGSGSVSVIDLKTKQRVANIPSGAGTEGIDVSPDQREVWATNRGGNTVSIIDVASSKIVATVDSKSFPIRAKFTDDGKHVLVSNAQSGDVAVFDAATPTRGAAHQDAIGCVAQGRARRHSHRADAVAGVRREYECRHRHSDRSEDLADRRSTDCRQGAGRARLLAARRSNRIFLRCDSGERPTSFAHATRGDARVHFASAHEDHWRHLRHARIASLGSRSRARERRSHHPRR